MNNVILTKWYIALSVNIVYCGWHLFWVIPTYAGPHLPDINKAGLDDIQSQPGLDDLQSQPLHRMHFSDWEMVTPISYSICIYIPSLWFSMTHRVGL